MTGYTFAYYKMGLSTLKTLWQQVFEGMPLAFCFNGRISGYELGADTTEPSEGFATSISGSAFNANLELRWKQVAAGTFKVLVLTETDLTQPDHDMGLKLPAPTEFTVVSGRRDDAAKSKAKEAHIILQALNKSQSKDVWSIEAERRLPNPSKHSTLKQVNYLYYQDTITQQVRFIRFSTTQNGAGK
jgi:hypothetical protein